MAVPPQLLMILVEAVSKLPNLIGATNALKDKIDAAIDFADKAQQTSLALGQTYEETRKTLGAQIEGLRGSLADRFRAGIETLNAGMTGNTMGVSRLINQQMLTNTAFRNTADTFAKLEVALGLTNEETNNLALSMLKLNKEYQISTDKLVQALIALKETMPVQKLAGFGDSFQKTIAELQGIVGPQLAQELTTFLKGVLDPSFENLSRLATLGILEQRQLLLANKDNSGAMVKILEQMVKTSAARIGMFGQGAETDISLATIPQQLAGPFMISLSLVEGLGKRIKSVDEYVAEYYLTIQNLKKELFVPLESAFTTLHKPLLALYEVLAYVAKVIGTGVGKWLETTLSVGSDTLKEIKIGLLTFSKTVIEIFYPLVTYIGDNASDLFKTVLRGILDTFINFTKPGGVLTQLEGAFYSLYASILHISDFFGADIEDADIQVYEKKAILKDIEVAIAEGATSISDLTATQREAIEDFKLGGKVAEAFRSYAAAADKNDALTKLSLALGGAGEKPEMVKKLEQAIQLVQEGKPLDESMLAAMLRVAENTEKDVEIRTPEFMQQSMDILSASLEKVFGAGVVDSSEGVINAIQHLDGTVQRAQLKARALGSNFRGIEIGY